jgi:nickel-dependent lactate racemase
VVIRELLAAGLSPDSITVIVATGLHRPNEGAELRELVGDDWVLDTVKVVNHYARIEEDHVDLGITTRGTRIKLDRRFVHADLRLAIGLVEPHFMAGYSGGRKVVLPGIAYQDTIRTFHKAVFLEHPSAKNCVLEGNPLHQEQLEATELLGRTLAINAVIDENRNMSYLNFGEITASHLEAVGFADKFSRVSVLEKFATVITSGGGYPLDKTYYQTIKGMVGAMDILAPSGQLVIASECSEGMGSSEFLKAQTRLLKVGNEKFLTDILAKRHAAIDEWQTEMLLKPLRIGKIHLFSDCLDFTYRQMTGVHVFESIDRTVRKCVEESGKKRVAVIPEGPYVIPTYEPAND